MNPLNLTGLSPLMNFTCGIPEVVIGLIDGPVALDHPDLTRENVRTIPGRPCFCTDEDSAACRHGTFLAGMLNAKRSSEAPSLCPGCTLLIRPVFREWESKAGEFEGASPVELASAIIECIDHGARILNLSLALEFPVSAADRRLKDALDYAAQRGVLVVAAAGNQAIIGGSVLTRHPWVLPVAACDSRGRPAPYSNMAGSIGKHGIMAPGEKIVSLGSDHSHSKFCGTSTAAAFVTGAIALLWSIFPGSAAAEIKAAITGFSIKRQRSCDPPLLNAWDAYRAIKQNNFSRAGKLSKFAA